MANENIQIKSCPICGKPHKYVLSITYAKYLYSKTNLININIKIVKRLLTCPTTNEFFEAILELREESQSKIAKINVTASRDEDKNEDK